MLSHNFYKFKFVIENLQFSNCNNKKYGYPPPKGVLLRNFNQIVTRKGIKPISAGLGAAAQSLYQRANLLEQQNLKGKGFR